MGLGYDTGGLVLNDLAERVRKGTRFTHGQILTDVLKGGYNVTILDVPDPGGRLNVASRLYYELGDQPLPARQVVWPDTANRMPWDLGYDGPDQPLLGQPPR